MSYEIIETEKVFNGRVFDVRRDQVRLPDGRTARLDIVDHNPAVTLLPLDEMGRIWFIRQYRHPAAEVLLELPAGVVETGEEPEKSAGRELQEEIGMSAQTLEKLGEFYLAPGYSTEYMYLYLATGLSASVLPHDEDEFIEIEQVPVSQAYQMAYEGRIRDGKTLAALFLAQPRLKGLRGSET